MKTERWRIEGKYEAEIELKDGEIWDLQNDFEFPFLASLVSNEAKLVINFVRQGFYTPASFYGGPHGLGYPEESDEEYLLETVLLDGKCLSHNLAVQVFDKYSDLISVQEECK